MLKPRSQVRTEGTAEKEQIPGAHGSHRAKKRSCHIVLKVFTAKPPNKTRRETRTKGTGQRTGATARVKHQSAKACHRETRQREKEGVKPQGCSSGIFAVPL